MPDKTLTVVARFKAKAGKEAQLRGELLKLISPTRSEEGCVNYDLHESSEHPGEFLFYENWTSQEALDKHLQAPHVKSLLGKSDQLVAEQPEITLWNQIDQR